MKSPSSDIPVPETAADTPAAGPAAPNGEPASTPCSPEKGSAAARPAADPARCAESARNAENAENPGTAEPARSAGAAENPGAAAPAQSAGPRPEAPYRSDLSLTRLRLRLAARWLRRVGWFLPVVLLFAAGVAALFLAVAGPHPLWATGVAALLLVRFHLTRRDTRLAALMVPHPHLSAWLDCLALAVPASLLLLAAGHPWHALGLLAAAPNIALLPRTLAAPHLRSPLRIGWLAWSPEWCAALRRHRITVLLLALGALLLAAVPYWSFIYLGFTALIAVECYTRNEPLALLLLPELDSSRLLARKVGEALRNYLLATAPFALAAALLHPRAAWVAALWLAFSTLVLLYAVLAKYALYDPAEPRPAASTAMLLGLLGFLLPPLLPVSLVLLIRYGLRAERNLNRYLHDYSR